jgi:hypothetical protein
MRHISIAATAVLAAASFAAADTFVINVDGVESWDSEGSPNNTVLSFDVASAIGLPAGTDVIWTGAEWDVTITPQGGSWYSEAVVGFDTGNLSFAPGFGDDFSGTDPLSYSGVVNFQEALGTDFLIAGGVLTLEFYESFDDAVDTIDALWSGSLTLTVIPAPGAMALLGVAGLAGTRRRRG